MIPSGATKGKVVGAINVFSDVTELKRAEHDLRDHQAMLAGQRGALEAAISGAPLETSLGFLARTAIGAMDFDARAAFYLANEERTALTHVVGMPADYAAAVDGFKVGPDSLACGLATATGEPKLTADVRNDPLWRPWLWMAEKFDYRGCWSFPIRSPDGSFYGTLAVYSRQPREASQHDQEVCSLLTHTASIIISRHKEMEARKQAEESLLQSDRRKDEFLATLAHELRNPLAPVRNAVNVLRLKGPDEPALRWSRDVIERQVDHLCRLIDDLMDIARITRNKLELRRQRVGLAEIIQGAVESSRPNIEQCGHELTVTLPPQPVYLNGDLVRLTQVFLNLLNNAAKYTERGGRIELTALLTNPDSGQPEVVVSVKDSGVGVPAEKLSSLFEMFFQVDHSLEKSQGGLGIGLSLVRRLVELHGGKVEARSDGDGQGSEFIVRLPALVEQATTAQLAAPNGKDEARDPLPARRILVVDDNRDSADSLALLLRLSGNDVHTAYDGIEAVEAAERLRPDVVLLDIGMPKLNGKDACRRMRKEAWSSDMVLIALTGWGQEADRRQCAEVGFDHHMTKPVDPTSLIQLLASRSQTSEQQLTNH